MLADIVATGRQVTQKQANAVLRKQADLTPDQWNALYGAGIGAGVGGVGGYLLGGGTGALAGAAAGAGIGGLGGGRYDGMLF
jgi:uncharacterized protein YcfJ